MAEIIDHTQPNQPTPPQQYPVPQALTETATQATHREATNTSTSDDVSPKPNRRSKFTAEEDLILVREVAAAKAHIAPHGKKGELFAKAAEAANNNPKLGQTVTQKSIQDRYARLKKDFDENDKKESVMSGVGGEIGEMSELLSEMRQAREDKVAEKSQQKAEVTALEAQKEEIGALLVSKALNRQAPGPSSGATSEAGTPKKVGKGNGKRRREMEDEGNEMASFTDAVKQSEVLRTELESRKLEFEEKRLRIETEERAKDREERREEREAQAKLDLDKFRLMMDSQASMMKEIVRAIRKD